MTGRYTPEQMARRIAAELGEGWVVNLGIGMPTSVLSYIDADRDLIFHSENGIVGMGPILTDPALFDPDLASAGRDPVGLVHRTIRIGGDAA